MSSQQRANTQLRIGLTGGIASGKSAVADHFSDHGIDVIDADLIAREVVEPGQPGLAAVAAAFGPGVVTSDGHLDRARLRQQAFADAGMREKLEAILHPLIRKATLEHAQRGTSPYQVFAVPLLTETGFGELVDRILVVDCPTETQIERLIKRDGETEASARNILAAQASREDRLAIADDVLTNTGSLSELEAKVDDLHARYLALALNPT